MKHPRSFKTGFVWLPLAVVLLLAALPIAARAQSIATSNSLIVDAGQVKCYNASTEIACPAAGAALTVTRPPAKTTISTRTPTMTRTSAPTKTSAPTRTPAMTRTSAPTKTNTPTRTPTMTRTSTPTKTNTPTRTPTPTVTRTPTTTFTIEQTLSDEAQRNTIAFDGLAFLTGNFGSDSFFPPGKVADFWGFQFLRDNDPTEMGHNTDFLTRAALNMLYTLTPAQRANLIALAESQVDDINQYATNRFVLMDAFRRLLAGDLPPGSTGLDAAAVQAYSADLYRLDGEISYDRAQLMGGLITALDATQRAYLDAMVGQGMLTWPVVDEPEDLRGLDRDVKVAVMTYAGDMFSWYAGSIEDDVYFCPERQGTYFGSFYMKDAPAVGNPGYSIPVTLTGELGATFLRTLTSGQSPIVTNLVADQKPALYEIVDRREDVSALLRQFMSGGTPDRDTVLRLMDRYGELDGEIVYRYATAFAQIDQSLTADQRAQLMALRTDLLGDLAYPTGAYLYAEPIALPTIPNTDFLFTTSGTVSLLDISAPPTQTMTISQTLSDEAQRNTLAFDGLAFLTGSLGADSFFPPGKVADFWGFQYLRDNDPSQMGHNPLFLTSAAFNLWNVLTTDQRAQLKTLANNQVSSINNYAAMRFVLMKAFRRLLEGDVPAGSPGLDEDAVKAYSADLYRLDGQMSYDRAVVMGGIIRSLSVSQTTYLNTNLVGKGMLEWPAVSEPSDMQGLPREVKEALMTYAGDIYSWYAGSIEADVYFCPERQGTYFGSFYLKDTPVMSTGGSIDPNLTASAGITFLLTLTPTQKTLVTGLVDIQKSALYEIVDRREDMSTQFRRFIAGQPVSLTEVLSQATRYGELDGEIVYNIATNFAAVSQTLTSAQRTDLLALRTAILGNFDLIPEPYAYRYSDRIPMPTITNTDFLFLPGLSEKVYLPLVGLGMSDSGSTTLLKLPDTGQVTSYTPTFGEDSDYTINPPAYTVNGNGTVTDQVTGLTWQQTDGGEMTFANAVTYCQNLELAGYADWQLPSSHELFGIVDHDHNPALNTSAFPATAAEYWWTANEQVGDSAKAWVVNAGGGIGAHPKSETLSAGGTKRFHTRCVRNVPADVTSNFTANGNGAVTDDNTGLMWQQAEVTPTVTWEAALTYCENLSLGDHADWRLPNIKELRSISDDTRANPSVDTTFFPGAQAARYWSSTTLFGPAVSAWFVDFTSGLASYNDKTGQLSVRCVRSDQAQ